jgi:glycosyltransferase involved in cell wall biosynthesis
MTTPWRGGGEFAAVDLLNALAARGHEVVFLTNQPDLARGTSLSVHELELGPKLARRTVPGLTVRWLPYRRRMRAALARELPYDVLLVYFKKEQLMASRLPARLRRTTAWAEWGPLPRQFHRGLPAMLYRRAARRAGVIFAVSENTRDSIVGAGVPGEKVIVVPNVLDVDGIVFDPAARERYRREWGVDNGRFVIGCVTRFHAKKRNDVIIDALAYLPDDVVAVFAGDGDDEAALRARAAPFRDRVRFLPTPRGYVHELLSACDVEVLAPQSTEGAPRAIGFGQLVQRPVIATANAGAVSELIGDGTGAVVSPANDPRALARLLAEYRNDPARREREGAAGRRLAAGRNAPDVVAAAVEQAMERSLGDRAIA